MRCPHCLINDNSPVIETRAMGEHIFRRRRCVNCGNSYITREDLCDKNAKMPRPDNETRRERKEERALLRLGKNERLRPLTPEKAKKRSKFLLDDWMSSMSSSRAR